jgi:transposase
MFYGIDLHTDSFVAAKLDSQENADKATIKTNKYFLQDSFQQFKDSLNKDDYILIEACGNAFWFYDQVIDLVKDCYVLDVNKYYANNNKTDKLDAKKLAKKLAYYVITHGDSDDLPLVYVPPKAIRELRGLFTSYKLNKKAIVQFKNRIHSIFKENGFNVPKKLSSTLQNRTKLLELPISDIWKSQLKVLFSQIDALEEETEKIKQLIYELGYQLYKEEITILLSIKGFSPLTAIALMSDIIDIKRFPNAKKFCSYLRTAPRVHSSNKTTVIGPTNKFSRTLTCSLLSQSIEHFAVSSDYLKSFYERVKQGKKPGVYRMALIRKILVCAYYMLNRKKLFYWVNEKLYQQKLQELNSIIDIKKAAA